MTVALLLQTLAYSIANLLSGGGGVGVGHQGGL